VDQSGGGEEVCPGINEIPLFKENVTDCWKVRSAPDTILPEILNGIVISSDETSGTLLIYVGEELPGKGAGGFFTVPGDRPQRAQEMLFRPGPFQLPGQEVTTWNCVSHCVLGELPEFFVKFLVKGSSDSDLAFLYPVQIGQEAGNDSDSDGWVWEE